jgi:hypothetical protein
MTLGKLKYDDLMEFGLIVFQILPHSIQMETWNQIYIDIKEKKERNEREREIIQEHSSLSILLWKLPVI